MTHEEFIELWERACQNPHRVQSMYFGGSHGFCSQWRIELWWNGSIETDLMVSNCGIWDSPEARKEWELFPSLNGDVVGGGRMTNEQTLRCVAAYDQGKKGDPIRPL